MYFVVYWYTNIIHCAAFFRISKFYILQEHIFHNGSTIWHAVASVIHQFTANTINTSSTKASSIPAQKATIAQMRDEQKLM